jgi:hypothetical protein
MKDNKIGECSPCVYADAHVKSRIVASRRER